MPLTIDAGRPSILIRREAYENAVLARSELDSRFNLTDAEFRVERDLIVVGPLASDDLIGPITDYLEEAGLTYFDDFFELSGNWPEWLRIYVGQETGK
jgi:hypothetical protein